MTAPQDNTQRYAICPAQDGKLWWVLEAQMPCLAGQGKTIAMSVPYDEMVRLVGLTEAVEYGHEQSGRQG